MKNILNEKRMFFGRSRLTLWFLLGIFVVFAFLAISSINVNAATINVPDDYPTIQQAIDNATAGDIVNVAAGRYYENIVMKSGVIIQGVGADVSIIDGVVSCCNCCNKAY